MDSSLLLTQLLGDKELSDQIKKSRLLLVGAGGIGSEVIKNLLLMGFETIDVIDLDTIDVSNLNRQFLFNRQHVGKSKAEIAAKVSVENFGHNSSVNVKAIHNSIQSSEFDIEFYKSYTLVINALDNRAARSHVNRMCLAADVPLIESGSEGYMGQVFLIKKGVSQCYECGGPKADSKTYASCTIRNTPSLPIHCIVWAKHLFAQLFGEEDADNDVSPDMNDPELEQNKDKTDAKEGDNGIDKNGNISDERNVESNDSNTNGSSRPQSTREWAQNCDYNTKQLFDKLFETDIEYLLRMDKLWENRQKPFPINYDKVISNEIEFNVEGSSRDEQNGSGDGQDLETQKLWTIKECLNIFDESIKQLKERLSSEKFLVWDKDDESALNFVTSVSNLRSFCFHISRKSKFDVKSMAGNIIPAISSTNSIVGGLIVIQCLNILKNLIQNNKSKEESDKQLYDSCRHIYLRKVGPSAKNLIAAYDLEKPNENCLICSSSVPEIEISLNIAETLLITDFVEQIIFSKLQFVCPDIKLDGKEVIIWSKEDYDDSSNEEKQRVRQKHLSDFKDKDGNHFIKDKTRLLIDDLLQDLKIIIILKDVKIDKNNTEGLFYSMVIVKEGDNPIDQNGNTSDEKTVESNDNKQRENDIKEIVIEMSDESVQQITVEDDDQNERPIQMEILESNGDNDVEEVTISDSDSDSEPEIIDDDSVDIIEVREKRRLDPEVTEESVIKKHKS